MAGQGTLPLSMGMIGLWIYCPLFISAMQAIIALYEHPANDRLQPTVSASMVKTPLTGVDRSTCFTLNFPTLTAQAQLSCNINIPPRSTGATLRFRNGNIIISEPLYRPKWYTVQYFDKPGSGKVKREETVHFENFGGGWHFQADEVARCVRDGKLESSVWGHDKTLLEMEIFDEVSTFSHPHDCGLLAANTRFDAKADIVFPGMLSKFHEGDVRIGVRWQGSVRALILSPPLWNKTVIHV